MTFLIMQFSQVSCYLFLGRNRTLHYLMLTLIIRTHPAHFFDSFFLTFAYITDFLGLDIRQKKRAEMS